MTGAGPSYTYGELVAIWEANGGSPAASQVAAAVALAESSGCRYALAGPVDVRPEPTCKWTITDGENSHGLWQINIAPGANPQYAGSNLFDPDVNAQAAITLSANGTDWDDWSTFNDHAYLAFLPGGSQPNFQNTVSTPFPDSIPVTPRPDAPVYAVNPIHLPDAWAELVSKLAHDLPASTKRVAVATAGIRGLNR